MKKKNSDINHINKNKKTIFLLLLLLFLLIIIKCCFLCVIVFIFFLLKRVREHLYKKFIVVILNLKSCLKVIVLKFFDCKHFKSKVKFLFIYILHTDFFFIFFL
jgi:hypothetical protein